MTVNIQRLLASNDRLVDHEPTKRLALRPLGLAAGSPKDSSPSTEPTLSRGPYELQHELVGFPKSSRSSGSATATDSGDTRFLQQSNVGSEPRIYAEIMRTFDRVAITNQINELKSLAAGWDTDHAAPAPDAGSLEWAKDVGEMLVRADVLVEAFADAVGGVELVCIWGGREASAHGLNDGHSVTTGPHGSSRVPAAYWARTQQADAATDILRRLGHG